MILEGGMNGPTKDPSPFSMDDLDLKDPFLQTRMNIFLHHGSGLFGGKRMEVQDPIDGDLDNDMIFRIQGIHFLYFFEIHLIMKMIR
jgi:hypothetical protein